MGPTPSCWNINSEILNEIAKKLQIKIKLDCGWQQIYGYVICANVIFSIQYVDECW